MVWSHIIKFLITISFINAFYLNGRNSNSKFDNEDNNNYIKICM